MISMISYFGVLIGGMILGLVFFGGLWFTIQKALGSKLPALWFGISLFLRIGITLGGFYLLTRGNLLNFAFCLPGFIVVKILFVHLMKQSPRIEQHSAGEKSNAA